MKKYIYLIFTLVLCASCQSIDKRSYNIDSVASPQGTEVFQPDWKNIAENSAKRSTMLTEIARGMVGTSCSLEMHTVSNVCQIKV